MASRYMDLERRTLLVQFIAVEPLTFYATSDGTDLVQDILRSKLARADADIIGQEGSLSIDDNGEFLTFEPTDTKNRTLHLPIEHLAYCGALRRMKRDPSDQRNPDQILRRDFENVDLANRYAQHIIGPPIFVSVFHGFDNALCYIFITQSSDDACLSVMKLMRAFKYFEQQQLEQQGQIDQGCSPSVPINNGGSPSSTVIKKGSPLHQLSQISFTDNKQVLLSPACIQIPHTTPTMYTQDPYQDDLVQRLLSNPNLQVVNQPYSSSAQIFNQHIDGLPFLSGPSPSTQQYPSGGSPMYSSYNNNNNIGGLLGSSSAVLGRPSSPLYSPYNNIAGLTGSSSAVLGRPPSPPIFDVSNAGYISNLPLNNNLPPQVIHKPSNQDITYKQNVIIRWLKPPTPPPLAPIIVREIQQPPEIPPPIIYRQHPPCPPTPPPIVVREQPPPCQAPGNPIFVEKRLPRTCLPPQVVVERCPAPPPKPQQIIYEKYLPQPPPQPRQVIVQRECCQPTCCAIPQQQAPCRRLVKEIIRQVPQPCAPAQPAVVCTRQQQQQIIPAQTQACQQVVPVYATRRHIVQPKGIRVIRQVVGPAQSSQIGIQQQQQFAQYPSSFGASGIQSSPIGIQQLQQLQQQQQQQFSQYPSSFGAAAIQSLPAGFVR
ncbi:unnamed protein product [Adineta steineri]|uniref:Uncharacterized protein n=1 Tax=Adineta steineri TaxID=433720 RepID=A0A814T624_9BILA|nr:unnamed protein product [Adineta steineri]CAF3642074.1 unnamed protein product [Adineta steineri]